MSYHKLLLCFVAGIVFVLAAPRAHACSFQIVESTTITITLDGVPYTVHHHYYAWVNCSETPDSTPTLWDPWPDGNFIGPPAPPPPPAPPTLDPCHACIDLCWAQYFLCISGEQSENWFGFCGIFCREGCRWDKELCIGSCATDGNC